VGYIPNLDVYFTEDEETFIKDSYLFKSVKLVESNESSLLDTSNRGEVAFSMKEEKEKIVSSFTGFSRSSIQDEMK
jgi:hypothetical protein